MCFNTIYAKEQKRKNNAKDDTHKVLVSGIGRKSIYTFLVCTTTTTTTTQIFKFGRE